jgi:hypothetical protein
VLAVLHLDPVRRSAAAVGPVAALARFAIVLDKARRHRRLDETVASVAGRAGHARSAARTCARAFPRTIRMRSTRAWRAARVDRLVLRPEMVDCAVALRVAKILARAEQHALNLAIRPVSLQK